LINKCDFLDNFIGYASLKVLELKIESGIPAPKYLTAQLYSLDQSMPIQA